MLELKHIRKTYKTTKGVETQALKDINLCFPKKGMVFVLGKSGSGKSTLLNVVGGLDQADEGEIIINGKSSNDFSKADYDSYRNTYIGFIFQEFNLMDDYTIEKNIALALQLQQKPEDHAKIEALLEKLDLAGYSGRYPNELSGGQKQRVAIARALVKEPEILMADEPTGALDSSTGKEIFQTLKELSKEKLVIVVSHDKDSAQLYADRIIEFKDGCVDSDTAPDVKEEIGEFHAIRSHLPFKDSFKLGFSCLGHKKIRMVFTILLTSFALLTLALSDAIGAFNAADAQDKAMQENGEHLAGVRYQHVSDDGDVFRSYYGSMTPISDKNATDIVSKDSRKFARVYDSDTHTLTLDSFGVNTLDLDVKDKVIERYYITEMNSFDDLKIKDVEGSYPTNLNQVAISSFLADIMIKSGITTEEGNVQYPKDYKDIIATTKIKVEDKWLSVSGIVKKDLSAYDSLKGLRIEQLSDESYKAYRMLSAIANKDCDKLYVKDGFVKSLELPKNNQLMPRSGNINLNNNEYFSIGTIAYPIEAVSYFDGTTLQSTDTLAKDEILLSMAEASVVLNPNNNIYDGNMSGKSEDEIKTEIERIAKQLVGKTINMKYNEVYYKKTYDIDTSVKVKGIIWPSTLDEQGLYEKSSMVSKDLIETYIPDTYYIGELLTNLEGTDASSFLKTYDINSAYFAHTIATADVLNVDSFASFATKVFLIASVAFFIFAAILMMNFIIVSISYRKKDIGILRAIGARSTDVLKIFVWEGITLAAISFVVTFAGVELLAMVVNNFAMEEVGIMISPIIITLRQPIILLLTVIAVTFLACAIPVAKIARQRPIDAIKK